MVHLSGELDGWYADHCGPLHLGLQRFFIDRDTLSIVSDVLHEVPGVPLEQTLAEVPVAQ